MFIVYHKWQQEQTKAIAKKVIEAMANLPEGMALMASYFRADQTGTVCTWQAKDCLTKMIPEMGT